MGNNTIKDIVPLTQNEDVTSYTQNHFCLYNTNLTTSKRQSYTPLRIGEYVFDTDLGKPVWWTGEKWVDANGADV